jgi:hypothetical protein
MSFLSESSLEKDIEDPSDIDVLAHKLGKTIVLLLFPGPE